LREVRLAKLEAEATQLKAEHRKREQARVLAEEKEIEEASDCPVAPLTPRPELSSITSGIDSLSRSHSLAMCLLPPTLPVLRLKTQLQSSSSWKAI